jgi:hypothetical protein
MSLSKNIVATPRSSVARRQILTDLRAAFQLPAPAGYTDPLLSDSSSPAGVLPRLLACAVIAAASWVLSLLVGIIPVLKDAIPMADNVFYNTSYHARLLEDRTAGPVIIVAVNDSSLADRFAKMSA